jgi:nitrate reductase molybdenum cofactor assembly chaperone NarJ/NarW
MTKECMTYKVISLLLSYPEKEIQDSGKEFIKEIKSEKLLSRGALKGIEEFIYWMESLELLDLQENYVDLFDRKKSLSLYIFEHIHGDSKERGQAMVDLLNMYKHQGMEALPSELPDYLPLFLEFLSTLPQKEAKKLLKEPLDILGLIQARLKKIQSSYSLLFEALMDMTKLKPNLDLLQKILSKDVEEAEIGDELDKQWEEVPVSFGGGQKDCSSCPSQKHHLVKE